MLVFSFLSHIKYKSYKEFYIYIYIYYANKLSKTTKFSNKYLFEKLHFRPHLLRWFGFFFSLKYCFHPWTLLKIWFLSQTLILCLVEKIWKIMEKGKEKITFCVILLGEKRGVKTNGAQVFYSQACQNTFSPNWREMWRENENTKMSSILDITILVQH